jgi:hypothetical protein
VRGSNIEPPWRAADRCRDAIAVRRATSTHAAAADGARWAGTASFAVENIASGPSQDGWKCTDPGVGHRGGGWAGPRLDSAQRPRDAGGGWRKIGSAVGRIPCLPGRCIVELNSIAVCGKSRVFLVSSGQITARSLREAAFQPRVTCVSRPAIGGAVILRVTL